MRARLRVGRYFAGPVYVMTIPIPLASWPYQIAYEWAALAEAYGAAHLLTCEKTHTRAYTAIRAGPGRSGQIVVDARQPTQTVARLSMEDVHNADMGGIAR